MSKLIYNIGATKSRIIAIATKLINTVQIILNSFFLFIKYDTNNTDPRSNNKNSGN